MYRLWMIAILGIVQAGCAYVDYDVKQENTAAQSAPLLVSASFLCGNQPLVIEQKDEADLTVVYDHQRYTLTRALPDDNARYVNVAQQVTWIRNNALATFQLGQQVFACHQLTDDLHFSVHGNEPFWSIEVNHNQAVITTPEATSDVIPLHDNDLMHQVKTYESADKSLSLHLTPQRCQDDMSGMYYPMQANVVYNDKAFAGCAGNNEYILAGQWKVISLDGHQVVSAIPLTLIFNEGQLTGSTGCNTFTGQYTLSAESFSIQQLAVADKICGTEQGRLETTLITRLKQVTQLNFEDDVLLLYSDDDKVIRARRNVD